MSDTRDTRDMRYAVHDAVGGARRSMPGQPIKCTQMADVRAVNEGCKLCTEWERDSHTGRQTDRQTEREVERE